MPEGLAPLKMSLQAAIARLKEDIRLRESKKSTHFAERFRIARQRLRSRILDEFKRDLWPQFQKLDEIFQLGLGLPVPTLSVCGSGTAEIRYTQLLAYFFDSQNRHGLGGLLARAVFADRIKNGAILPFEQCRAHAEISLGCSPLSNGATMQNSLDLLIEIGEHKILVEQKIRSGEGAEQLRRYTFAIGRMFGHSPVSCFFLTPDGKAGREENWLPLSHCDLLCRMASVLHHHTLSPVARHNLRALLWDLILGPLAQDAHWMDELQRQAHQVARDFNRQADLKNWFSRYGMSHDELRVIAQIVE